MKLLFVIPFYKPAYLYGGPVRSVPPLCEGLSKLGNDITVFTTDANGEDSLNVEPGILVRNSGVNVYYFHRDLPGSYFYSRELAKACYTKISEFDLVYVISNWGFPFLPACRAAGRCDVPYVLSPRTAFMRKTWKGKFLKKWLYHYAFERRLINHASAIHYTSQFEKHESDWLHLKSDSLIIPNPVDIKEFESLPKKGLFREKYGIPEEINVVLFLGRVEKRKGIIISLLAFSKFAKKFPNSVFVIAGPVENDYSNILQEISLKLGLSKIVIFTGYLDKSERLEAFNDANIFILTSYSENFGMAVIEAMAAGLPVLISDQVGIQEDIKCTKVGYIVPLDANLVSEKLIEFFSISNIERRQMGENAKNVAKKYSPHEISQSMLNEFYKII